MTKITVIVLLLGMININAQDSYSLNLVKSTLQISGTSTVSDWTVNAEKFTCDLNVAGEKLTSLDLIVPVADIKSERGAAMDAKMHTALKEEEFPSVTFNVKNQKNQSTITGDVTIAGVTKSVNVSVDLKIEAETVQIKGEKSLALNDFGIKPPSAMFGQIVVGPEVTIFFDLYFISK